MLIIFHTENIEYFVCLTASEIIKLKICLGSDATVCQVRNWKCSKLKILQEGLTTIPEDAAV